MDRSYGSAATRAINTNAPVNEDPFSIELSQLDVYDVAEDETFMKNAVKAKKALIEESKSMRTIFQLDQHLKSSDDSVLLKRIKRLARKKPVKVRHHSGDGEDNNSDDPDAGDEEGDEEEAQVEEDVEEVGSSFIILNNIHCFLLFFPGK